MRNKTTWIYKYENDALYPVLEVGNENKHLIFEINNPTDCIYTFCKVNIEEGFELVDTYTLQVPGNIDEPIMKLILSGYI